MEPRIQYAKTEDGVSIAYYTMGDGPVMVTMPMLPWSHVEKERQFPSQQAFLDASTRTVVRYDNRGSGLSTSNVDDYSVDAHVRDLEAVVDALGLDTFSLLARQFSAPPAIAFTVRNPNRVSHLVVWIGVAKGADFWALPQAPAVSGLLEQDWDLYIETAARFGVEYQNEEFSREWAAFARVCGTQEGAAAAVQAVQHFDVSELLAEVNVPTLVIHGREFGDLGLDNSRGLASGIPGASLVVVDLAGIRSAVSEFLGQGEKTQTPSAAPGGFATILFTDMESSTAITQSLGDAKAQELVHTHNAIVRDALKAHSGAEIKHTGDGIMASFSTVSEGLECAVAIQNAVAERGDEALHLRIGLNAGEPIAEEDDLFGTAVQLAKRICDHAKPGQILVPDAVRHLAGGKGFLFSDLGDVVPKGFEDPVKLWEVRWREEG